MVKKMYFLGMTLALVSCVLILPDTSYGEIEDGLISAWPLDEGAGLNAEDPIGGNNGDIRGGAAWVTGKFGTALSFDGADYGVDGSLLTDYVDCGSDASLQPSIVSVSAWVKLDVYPYYGQIAGFAHDESSDESGYSILADDEYTAGGDAFTAWISGSDEVGSYMGTTDVPAAPIDWTHVAMTYDGTTTKLYVNGVEKVSSTSESGDISYTHVTTFKIGLYQASGWWLPYAGLIDDVGIWDRALTQDEVSWLYNNGIGRPVPVSPLLPTPSNGSIFVPRSQVLSWELIEEIDVIGYDVWFGSDANEPSPNYDFTKVLSLTTNTSFDPFGEDPMEFETTYYWRVDIHEANDVGTIFHEGELWRFTTMPSVPILDADLPEDVVVDAGQTVTFIVDALNPLTEDKTGMTYEWYKAGEPGVLSITDTLEITDAQIANEGKYYCVVTVTENGKTSTSREADLIIKRLVGYWPFDKNLDDVEGGNDGTYTGIGKEVYGDGILNDALEFDGLENKAITVPSDAATSGYWSISFWEKSPLGSLNPGYMVGSGHTEGWESLFLRRWDNADEYVGAVAGETSVGFDYVGSYPRGQWHYHVCTMDPAASTATWYIDGVQADDDTPVVFTGFDPLIYIGNRKSGERAYEGLIDELKLYNYPLETLKVAENYNEITGEEVCLVNPEYDFNEDCIVDISDLTIFLEDWLNCNRYPATFCE